MLINLTEGQRRSVSETVVGFGQELRLLQQQHRLNFLIATWTPDAHTGLGKKMNAQDYDDWWKFRLTEWSVAFALWRHLCFLIGFWKKWQIVEVVINWCRHDSRLSWDDWFCSFSGDISFMSGNRRDKPWHLIPGRACASTWHEVERAVFIISSRSCFCNMFCTWTLYPDKRHLRLILHFMRSIFRI